MAGISRRLAVGTVVFVAALAIAIAIGLRPPPIAGSYVGKSDGKPTGTTLVVAEEGPNITFTLTGEQDLAATYTARKTLADRYVLEEGTGTSRLARFEVRRLGKRLDLEGWVLPVGKVHLTFERSR